MRYILDKEGYVEEISFGATIQCNSGGCTEYTGEVPNGYNSLCEWVEKANIRAYKLVEGNLVYDPNRCAELEEQFEQEAENHRPLYKSDLFEVDEKINQNDVSLKSQYKTDKATGKIVDLIDANTLSPNITITNIKCYEYSKLKLIASNKNLMPNTAISKSISGISFIHNKDKSITILGTATENIEYDIAGDNINVSPVLAFKKNVDYYLSSDEQQIKMYYYDGTERTEVYNGTGGVINFTDGDKKVTQIVLSIASGTTMGVTLYPQLELGSSGTDYTIHEEHSLEIDFAKHISETVLFPSDTLFPTDSFQTAMEGLTPSATLTPSASLVPKTGYDGTIPYPSGTSIGYLKAENNVVYINKNGIPTYLKDGYLSVLKGSNIVYATEDVDLDVLYYTNELEVDDLGFLQGKATTTNKFKILEDGSIEAHNGYFSGEINADSGDVGGWTINEEGLTNGTLFIKSNGYSSIYTFADMVIMRNYILGKLDLNENEIAHYDLNKDGLVNSQDLLLMQKMILGE